MNTKVTILFLLVAIAGTINIAPAEANQFRKLFTSPGQVLPPGTFQTCDAMIQYAQTLSPMKNPQCSEIILRPCCDECTYDQQNPSCQTCGKMQFYSNLHKLQAMGCLTPPPTRSNRRLRSSHVNLIDLVKEGSVSRVQARLRKGADVNQVDEDGKTALSWACIRNDEAMVKLLLKKKGIRVNTKDYLGFAPLLHAVVNAEYTLVGRLLKVRQIDVNTQNEYGETPLIYATINSKVDKYRQHILQLLRHPNIDVNMEDDGKTALAIAMSKRSSGYYYTYAPIVQWLKDAGGTM